MGSWYNGYSWPQRDAAMKAYRKEYGRKSPFEDAVCAICRDPNRPPHEWHHEDYSQPYLHEPPASYPLCRSCHQRLHKRFKAPEVEWHLFCTFIRSGGFGRDFTQFKKNPKNAPLSQRPLADPSDGAYWWERLTLDPQSLHSPWARPRPLRPRPTTQVILEALRSINLTDDQRSLLTFHAHAPRLTVTMRQLAEAILDVSASSTADAIYGAIGHRLIGMTGWEPDRQEDGTVIGLSIIAEGWHPPGREYQLTMVASVASAVGQL